MWYNHNQMPGSKPTTMSNYPITIYIIAPFRVCMKVITLDKDGLDKMSKKLASIVEADGRRFDAIVAVKSGGSIVCDYFCHHFPKQNYGFRTDVLVQRPTTKKKIGIVGKLLKKLPYWLLNIIRMGESRVYELHSLHSTQIPDVRVDLPESLIKLLKNEKTPQILIVDDAIDSGHTIAIVENSIKTVNNDMSIRVAVITVTTPNPKKMPEYYIFNNRTLIRFPWSNDYKMPKV